MSRAADEIERTELPLDDEYRAAFQAWTAKCFLRELPADQVRCMEMAFYSGVGAVLASADKHGTIGLIDAAHSIMAHCKRMAS